MKTILNDGRIKLECSDWRYSSAILGLIRYFEYNLIDYEIDDDSIIYRKEDITKENYNRYILERYKDDNFSYLILQSKLNKEEFTEEEIEDINKFLKSRSKPIQNLNLEFDGKNQEELLKILEENKDSLILNIFKNKEDGYKKFCNPHKIEEKDDKICRINGFYIDTSMKKNMLCWCNEKETFQSEDIQEFGFIPFGFSIDDTSLFINNNFSVKSLISANSHFNKETSSIISLYKYLVELCDKNIENNVEIILKRKDKNYFETLYIDKNVLDKLKKIKNIKNIYKLEQMKIQVRKDLLLDMNYILNLIFKRQNLDYVINLMLKEKDIYKNNIFMTYNYYLQFIIKINMLLNEKGEQEMNEKYKKVYACGKTISEKLEENKLNSYRQKLTSSLISNNKDSIYNILLQLSNYSHVNISFIYDILDDYENNKDLIYGFISSLTKQNKEKKEVENND